MFGVQIPGPAVGWFMQANQRMLRD